MANQSDNNFVTVTEKLTKKIGQTSNIYQDYLKNPNDHSVYLTEIELDAIKKQIKNPNNKKASDIFWYISKISEIFRWQNYSAIDILT